MKGLILMLLIVAPGFAFSEEAGVTATDIKVISDKMHEFHDPKALYSCESKGGSSRAPAVVESFGRKLKKPESK